MKIHIVDYGAGNVGSLSNMLKKIGATAVVTGDPDELRLAEKIILPGVGAFDSAMEHLEGSRLLPVLHEKVIVQQVPFLGICLGMQLLSRGSEEGHKQGLGWIDANTVRFHPSIAEKGYKIPHMGWSRVHTAKESPLLQNLDDSSRFYFVHSYHVACSDTADVLMTANYGYDFTAAILHKNIAAVQFHPEKSHKFGMTLLRNFAFQF